MKNRTHTIVLSLFIISHLGFSQEKEASLLERLECNTTGITSFINVPVPLNARRLYDKAPLTEPGFNSGYHDSLVVKEGKAKNTKPKKSPIPIETMFGTKKINYLSIVNLPLGAHSPFGYFGVMTISAPYHTNDGNNEFVFSNALTYKLSNTLFATGGLQYHFLKGIVPYSGFQFLSANPRWLFVISPGIAFLPNTSFQSVGIVEYKPKLSNKLRLYTRFQGIYNFKVNNGQHERSLVYIRTGLTLKGTSLGFGFNWDFYGSTKTKHENLGIFIHRLF